MASWCASSRHSCIDKSWWLKAYNWPRGPSRSIPVAAERGWSLAPYKNCFVAGCRYGKPRKLVPANHIRTTTDYFEWPRMTVSSIARYLCASWASCRYNSNTGYLYLPRLPYMSFLEHSVSHCHAAFCPPFSCAAFSRLAFSASSTSASVLSGRRVWCNTQ